MLRVKLKQQISSQYLNNNGIVFDSVEQMVVRETMKIKYTRMSAK